MGPSSSEKPRGARDDEPMPPDATHASAVATAADLFGLHLGHEEAASLAVLLASKKEDMLAIRELPLNELDLPTLAWSEMLP